MRGNGSSLVLYCCLLHYRDEVGEATLTVRSLKYVVCCSVDWEMWNVGWGAGCALHSGGEC